MRGDDIGVCLVIADTQANVAFAIKHDERQRVRDQHVYSQVELLSFQQQRSRYVPVTFNHIPGLDLDR